VVSTLERAPRLRNRTMSDANVANAPKDSAESRVLGGMG
jgi:hypothetical protein